MDKEAKKPNVSGQFERTFASLALAALKDRVVSLVQYMLGFQVIDKDDDDTRAVGVFAFDINGTKLYAPVFFNRGQLKGMDLLHVGERDLFIPFSDEWVNYVISRKGSEVGQGRATRPSDFMSSPDFDVYTKSPLETSFMKGAAEFELPTEITGIYVHGQAFDLAPFLSAFTLSPDSEGFKKNAEDLSVSAWFKDPVLRGALASTLVKNAKLREAFNQFYDIAELFKPYTHERTVTKRVFKAAAELPTVEKPKIIYMNDPEALELSKGKKDQLLQTGYIVMDKRLSTEKAEFIDTVTSFRNPWANGEFTVLFKQLGARKAFVSLHPFELEDDSAYKRPDQGAMLIDSDTKAWRCAPVSEIFVSDCTGADSNVTDFYDSQDSVKALSSVSKEDPIVLMLPNGRTTQVFYVTEQKPEIQVAGTSVRTSFGISLNSWGCSDMTLVVSPDVSTFRLTGNIFVAPSNSHVIKLNSRNMINMAPASRSYVASMLMSSPAYRPVGIAKKAFNRYQLTTVKEAVDKSAAVAHLVCEQGLGEDTALELLDRADKKLLVSGHIKLAAVRGLYDVDNQGHFDSELGVYVDEPHESILEVEDMQPGAEMGYSDSNRAQKSKDKELFDINVFSGLLRVNNVSDNVNKYVTDLVVGMDRIGRMLFLFYWRFDSFKDRYGTGELTELEDMLKSTFSSLGDIALFLRKNNNMDVLAGRGSDAELTEE
jgi:hypothetical protein